MVPAVPAPRTTRFFAVEVMLQVYPCGYMRRVTRTTLEV
jgi:hypothetical protein